MISIVVVYNNEQILNEILLKSLKTQTVKFEFIAIDNIKNKYTSAAKALNNGGSKANGKYIMFVHQDIELGFNLWLEKVESILDSIHDLGIAGVAGMSEEGRNFKERKRGYINSCGRIWGFPLEKKEIVQTLDECLLIVPKSVFEKLQFDEKTFDHWHCYGADYCLCVKQMRLNSYVIPAFVWHKSLRKNIKGAVEYQKKLHNKHQKSYKCIYTTSDKAR